MLETINLSHTLSAIEQDKATSDDYVKCILADPQIAAYQNDDMIRQLELARKYEDGVNEGPALKSSQMPYYAQSVRQRYQNNPHLLKRQGYGRW